MGNWDQFAGENEQRLRAAIELLAEIHGRKLSPQAMAHWLRRLLPLCGSGLFRALEAACDDRQNFQLAWIIETAAGHSRRDTAPAPAMRQPTPLEQDAADRAAVKSLLWLHYANGWSLDDLGRDSLGRLFARQRGISPEDVQALISAAMESYPRETILRWMDDTARANQ